MQPHAKPQLHLKRKLKLLTPVSLSSDSNPITEWGKKRVKKRALLGDFEVKARRLELRVCRFEKLSLDLCCISLLLSTKSALHTNTHSEIRYENEFILKFTGHITLLRNPPSSPRWFVFGGCVCVYFLVLLFCLLPWPWFRQPRRKETFMQRCRRRMHPIYCNRRAEGSLAQYQRLLSAGIITITPH